MEINLVGPSIQGDINVRRNANFSNVLVTPVQAQEESISSCVQLTTANQLFWCLVKNRAEVKLQMAEIKIQQEAISEALQMPNPDLEFEVVDNGEGGTTSEISLLHTIELGGKRAARESLAEAAKSLSESKYLTEQEEASRHFAIRLHRLRQIETELELANENLETFQHIQSQYKRLGRLNPEQSVSASVFEIAEQETQLKKGSLGQEKGGLLSEIQSIIGKDFKVTRALMPELKDKWPKIFVPKIKGSSKIMLNNKVDLAKANYQKAKSESWPNLSIGPKIERQTGAVSETKYGVALSMPLPVLNFNRGGRAKAQRQLYKAELQRKLQSERLDRHVEFLIMAYESSSQSVVRALKKVNIQKRHQNLHKLLKRGIVNSSLVIEMHREVFEFYKRLHEQELKAVDANWRLYALRGTLSEEKL